MKEKNKSSRKKITAKQVVAMTGVILLLLLYIITLVVAIVDTTAPAIWFFATVFIPILIWIYTWLWGKFTGKKTITDAPERKLPETEEPD